MVPFRWLAPAVLALVCVAPACAPARGQVRGGGVVMADGFDAALSPYGDWLFTSYGRAWRPWPYVVGPDFVPYVTGGRWVSSAYGWMFVTGWDWGWAPFHYGRWFYDPAWGWLWLPGNTWAPAWVEWRAGGGYVGWAPLGPPGWSWGWSSPAWCYVHAGALVAPEPGRHRVQGPEVARVHEVTTAVPTAAGPPPGEVSRYTGRPLPRADVRPPPPGRTAPARVELPAGVAAPPPPAPARVPGAPPPRPVPVPFPERAPRTLESSPRGPLGPAPQPPPPPAGRPPAPATPPRAAPPQGPQRPMPGPMPPVPPRPRSG